MKKKIIIIEDDPAVRENIYTLLLEEGFETYMAKNGEEGTNLVRKILPDLIICDVMMIGKDGFEVLKELQHEEATKRIPFIFLTAKVEKEDIRTGMRLGADDYLLKPFNSQELLNSINLRFKKIELLVSGQENNIKSLTIEDKVFIQVNNKPQLIKINEVLAINAENQYTKINLLGGQTYLVRKSVTEWEKNLPADNFLRIHRSTIINLNFIQKIEKWYNSGLLVYIKGLKEPLTASKRFSAKLRKNIF